MEVLAVIPARSGSKGLPDKNIRPINGKPMIAYSIQHALDSKLINRVIVSTDSEQYMEIARQYGAETPFRRPDEFAQDDSLDFDVFYHTLSWLRDNEGYNPDICVQLRPCCAVRYPEIIDQIIQRFIDNPEWDSIRAVSRSTEIPHKMWYMAEDNQLLPIIHDIEECYNIPRQKLPTTYFQNGYLDAFRPNVVLEKHSMSGDKIGGYVVDEYFDVDYPEDVISVEHCLKIRTGSQTFLVEADGLLMDVGGKPITAHFDVIKRLRLLGHKIYVYCPESLKSMVSASLGDVIVEGITSEWMEADYVLSHRAIGISEIQSIIER